MDERHGSGRDLQGPALVLLFAGMVLFLLTPGVGQFLPVPPALGFALAVVAVALMAAGALLGLFGNWAVRRFGLSRKPRD